MFACWRNTSHQARANGDPTASAGIGRSTAAPAVRASGAAAATADAPAVKLGQPAGHKPILAHVHNNRRQLNADSHAHHNKHTSLLVLLVLFAKPKPRLNGRIPAAAAAASSAIPPIYRRSIPTASAATATITAGTQPNSADIPAPTAAAAAATRCPWTIADDGH